MEVRGSIRPFSISEVLIENKWMPILSESTLKVILTLYSMQYDGSFVCASYNTLMGFTGLSKASVYFGLVELELYRLIIDTQERKNRAKVYILNSSVRKLDEENFKFLSNTAYRNIFIKLMTSRELASSEKKVIENVLRTGKESYERKTFVKLLYYKDMNIDMTIDKILFDGGDKMSDDAIFTDEELGIVKNNDWKNILKPDEKEGKIYEVIEYFFGFKSDGITREDVDYIKMAYKLCFPNQIKTAIRMEMTNEKYGSSIKSFKYIYHILTKKKYGTREKNNYKTTNQKNSPHGAGWSKKGNASREDMVKILEDMSQSGGSFSFEDLKKAAQNSK